MKTTFGRQFIPLIAAAVSCLLCAQAPAAARSSEEFAVRIVSPSEKERVTEDTVVKVEVSAGPGQELDFVEVFLDERSLGRRSEPPFDFPVAELGPGSVHRIRAEARSRGGLVAVDTLVLKQAVESSYSVRVDLVTVYVSVTDAAGLHLRGLAKDDFLIEEDGVAQEVAVFSSEATPLTAALLMDISSSMIGDRIIRSQAAAMELVDALIKEEDRAMVLGFDHRLILYQPLTNDAAAIKRAVGLTGPNGGTALYDAVAGTVRKLFKLKGKRAIVLLSDGDDTDSTLPYEDVLEYLQKAGIIVYSVGLQTLTVAQTRPGETQETIRALREMAEVTGGQAYFPSFISHLPEVYAAIGRDLSSLYTLSYYPSNPVRDGKWRSIAVKVRGRPDLALRHRKGYFATP